MVYSHFGTCFSSHVINEKYFVREDAGACSWNLLEAMPADSGTGCLSISIFSCVGR
uniref:Uncharacterized protein n=1 Tax=Parascaris equorum TaxID=6256 RepID=A0A914RFG6_PAREQ